MRTIGKQFKRLTFTMILLALAFAVAVPQNAGVNAAAALASDDFNRCSLGSSWTFENPGGFPALSFVGQYQGDASLRMTVPAGQQASFSNTSRNAPRIWQTATDADQTVEVKFNTALGQPPSGAWKIQGLLFRDSSSVPGKTRWLRIELNSNASNVHYYIGYIDEDGVLHKITGPSIIASSTSLNTAPLYLRVRYAKATGAWSVGYALGGTRGVTSWKTTFTESQVTGLDGDFVLTHNGIFVGQTGSNPPGVSAEVDYFRNVLDASFTDDATTLTVNTAGDGQGTVNWPQDAVCEGNTVSLRATPAAGSRFDGWTGDVTSGDNPVTVTMTQSRVVTANFALGSPEPQDKLFYLPYVTRTQ